MPRVRRKSANDIRSQANRLSQQLLTSGYAARSGSDNFNRRNDRIQAIARRYRNNIGRSNVVRGIMRDVGSSVYDREMRAENTPISRNTYMGMSRGNTNG